MKRFVAIVALKTQHNDLEVANFRKVRKELEAFDVNSTEVVKCKTTT